MRRFVYEGPPPHSSDMSEAMKKTEDEDGLKVLPLVQTCEPAGTRTQGPRLKRANRSVKRRSATIYRPAAVISIHRR